MRYDAEHKQRTRATVLKEAARSLRAHGPQNLGVADVMKRAGLTHGGFYAHFKSKEDLLTHAVEQMFTEALAQFDAVTLEQAAPAAMAAYVRFYLSTTHLDARETGCPLAALSTEIPRMHVEAREAFERGAAKLASRIAALLENMKVTRPGPTAVSVLSELVGALALARTVRGSSQSEAIRSASISQIMDRLGLGEMKTTV